MLQQRGVRKRDNELDNLKKFLQLDNNYPNLLMLKKVAKALDEMAKNEELMGGILAAAEQDLAAEEDQDEEDNLQEKGGAIRLNTIGEDEEDRHHDTNKDLSKGGGSK